VVPSTIDDPSVIGVIAEAAKTIGYEKNIFDLFFDCEPRFAALAIIIFLNVIVRLNQAIKYFR
jgi:hypothetical protein